MSPPLDLDYLQGLEAKLQDWASAADDEAFAGLWILTKPYPTLQKRRLALVVSAPHLQTNSDRNGVAECLRQLLPLRMTG